MPTQLQAVLPMFNETTVPKSAASPPQTCTTSLIDSPIPKMRGSPDQWTWIEVPKTGTVLGRRHPASATHAFQTPATSVVNSPKQVSTRVGFQEKNIGKTAESLTDSTTIATPTMNSIQRRKSPAAATRSGQGRKPHVTRGPTRVSTRVGVPGKFLPSNFLGKTADPANSVDTSIGTTSAGIVRRRQNPATGVDTSKASPVDVGIPSPGVSRDVACCDEGTKNTVRSKHLCCGRVEDKTVNQHRRGHEAEEAERRRSEGERERKSEGESSDRIQNELEPAIEIKTVETVETVSADGIGGRDGATMANGVTMATRNHSSFFMALAFGIVFGGGLFALRRKVSLNLMVVVV